MIIMIIIRVRAENMRLRWEIEKQKQDEERYMKLQYEVEHLTSRLHKVISDGQIAVIETRQLISLIANLTDARVMISHHRSHTRSGPIIARGPRIQSSDFSRHVALWCSFFPSSRSTAPSPISLYRYHSLMLTECYRVRRRNRPLSLSAAIMSSPRQNLFPIFWESFNLRCYFLSLACSIYIMFVGSLNPLFLDGSEQTGVWGLDGAAWIIHLNVLKSDEPQSRDSAARTRVQELQHPAARAETRDHGSGAHVLAAEVTCSLPGHERGHVRRGHQARGPRHWQRLPLPAATPGQAEVQTPGPLQK